MRSMGKMTFRRYGRSYHLALRDAEDLRWAVALDTAHWMVTMAPRQMDKTNANSMVWTVVLVFDFKMSSACRMG